MVQVQAMLLCNFKCKLQTLLSLPAHLYPLNHEVATVCEIEKPLLRYWSAAAMMTIGKVDPSEVVIERKELFNRSLRSLDQHSRGQVNAECFQVGFSGNAVLSTCVRRMLISLFGRWIVHIYTCFGWQPQRSELVLGIGNCYLSLERKASWCKSLTTIAPGI